VVSAVPLAMAVILPREPVALRRLIRWLVGFAVGALLGASFLHLLPDAFSSARTGPGTGALVVLGFFGFFVLERYLWRHGHGRPVDAPGRLPPLASINLIGDALHNALDGMAIAAAFSAGPSLGVATTVAVVFHEVPQEIGDFGILLHAGLTRRRAILWNLVSATAAFGGALAVLLAGALVAGSGGALVPVVAGGFIYIAASDLVPELKEDGRGWGTVALLVVITLGVGLSALPLLLVS
jgi:zinc and cadmium transporter